VFHLIRDLRAEITPAIATCLLTSIIVDTGAFRFSNTRSKTFEICAKLCKKGVDIQHLIEEAYWVRSRSMVLLSSFAMLNAKFSKDGNVAWAVVSQRNLQRLGAGLSDADSVADDLRSIEGVKIAALFRQTERGQLPREPAVAPGNPRGDGGPALRRRRTPQFGGMQYRPQRRRSAQTAESSRGTQRLKYVLIIPDGMGTGP